MVLFLLFGNVVNIIFQNELSVYKSDVTSKNGLLIFENVNVFKIQVSDDAVVSLTSETSRVQVDKCVFDDVTSNSGACCFKFSVKSAYARNSCFSNLFPSYVDSSRQGGCCVSISSATDAKVELLGIYSISYIDKSMYNTLSFVDCNSALRNINQTKCYSLMKRMFASGFFYERAISNDAFAMIIDSHGDFINTYYSAVKNIKAEKFCFANCSTTSGLIRCRVSGYTLTMSSCVAKGIKGPMVELESGNSVFDGWYTDTELSSSLTNTVKIEFEIPIKNAECVEIPKEKDSYGKSMQISLVSLMLTLLKNKLLYSYF